MPMLGVTPGSTMRISPSNLSTASARAFVPPTDPKPTERAVQKPTDQFTPQTPGPLDLFRKLAEAARHPAPAEGEATPAQPPAQGIASLLEGIFGIKVARLDLGNFATSHDLQEQGSASLQAGPAALDYAGSYHRIEQTRMAAEGTVTTTDGRSFTFSLDYFRHQEVAINQAVSVRQGPPPPVDTGMDQAKPPQATAGPSILASLRYLWKQHEEFNLLSATSSAKSWLGQAYEAPAKTGSTVNLTA